MKNKHLVIQKDKELLEQISLKLKNEIQIDPKKDKQKLTFKFIIYALLLISLYTLILTTNNSLYLTSAYILFGFSALLITFNFAHDLSHNSIFKSKKINNFFYTIILTMMGAHAEAWKKRHVHSHHHAPNVKDYDTDLQITSLIRVEPSAEKKMVSSLPTYLCSYCLFYLFFILVFNQRHYCLC